MGLWSETLYRNYFSYLDSIKGGLPMPQPGQFTSKKETLYPLYWTINGVLGRNGVPQFFL